jgi:branched-chain amino acid transport system ATP-binding protein
MSAELLRIEGVSAGYHDIRALWEVSLTVRAGEVSVLLGRNGAGKTTLLSTVAGLLRATTGRIVLDGQDLTGLPAHKRARAGLGLVQENKRIFRRRTVEENLQLGAFWRYRSKQQLADAMEREYERFPILHERRSWQAGRLSGGEQQMLAISQALVAQPSVLMLDEPSAGLAPEIMNRVWAAVADLRDAGLAIILVEQVVHGPLEIADTVGVLELGRLVMSRRKDELKDLDEIQRVYFSGATTSDTASEPR